MGKIGFIITIIALIGIFAAFPFLLWFLLLFAGILALDIASKRS